MQVVALITLCVATALAVPNGYGAPEIRISSYDAPIIRSSYEAPIVRSAYEAPIVRTESYGSYSAPALIKSAHVPIVKHLLRNDNAGSYNLEVQSGDGTSYNQNGNLKNVGGAEGPAVVTDGSYSWTSPEGQSFTVTYTADENGFRAQGAHLPTPPPVPEEILKSLALPRIPEYQSSSYAAPALKADTGYYSAPAAPAVRVQSYGY